MHVGNNVLGLRVFPPTLITGIGWRSTKVAGTLFPIHRATSPQRIKENHIQSKGVAPPASHYWWPNTNYYYYSWWSINYQKIPLQSSDSYGYSVLNFENSPSFSQGFWRETHKKRLSLEYYKFGFEKSIVFSDGKIVRNSKSQNCRCTDDSLAHTHNLKKIQAGLNDDIRVPRNGRFGSFSMSFWGSSDNL